MRQSGRFGQYYLTPRHALQQLGTEFGRACYPDIWVEYTMRVAQKLLKKDYELNERIWAYTSRLGLFQAQGYRPHWGSVLAKGVVIPDVRFKNEADAIFKAGGDVWRIERPGAGLQGEAAKHISETEQTAIPCVHVMNNAFDLDTLEALVAFGLATTFDENGVRRG